MIQATRPELGSYDEYIKEICDIWDTGFMTNNGPKVQKFREMLIERIGCKNAELFVNGHSALFIALKALELPKGGEVLTSPFTFASTTNAIVQAGLTPVFCDIDRTYNIDIESIKRNITERTCAIVTPHIFGIPCHVYEIEEIGKKHRLWVVFDGAQAFGTKVDGIDIGCFGDVTMFSFHAIKVFNSVEGGLLTFKDEGLKRKFESYRNFGLDYGSGDVGLCGCNAKMNEFQAAMGLVNLRSTDDVSKRRMELAALYLDRLKNIKGIEVYPSQKNIEYNHAYFPILVDEEEYGKSRDELWQYLDEKGIGSRRLYNVLTCEYSVYRNEMYKKDIPYAEEISARCLDLPMYSTLEEKDIDVICEEIRSFKS